MARITPIDVIKGISGKYGSGSHDYFATNTSSNRIRLAKYLNKPTGEPTQEQQDQMDKFAAQQKLAAAWLHANRPSDENGTDGTAAYQEAQALKKQYHLSNVRQIVLKYMDADGTVTLPSGNSQSSYENDNENENSGTNSGSANSGTNTGTDSGSTNSGTDSGSTNTGTDSGSTNSGTNTGGTSSGSVTGDDGSFS